MTTDSFQNITADHNDRLTIEDFSRYLQCFPRLETLDLSSFPFLPLEGKNLFKTFRYAIINTCPNLKAIRGLDIFFDANKKFIDQFLKKFKHQIEELNFDWEEGEEIFEKTKLKRVISRWNVDEKMLNERLEMIQGSELFDDYIEWSVFCPNLRSVNITVTNHKQLLAMKNLKNLKQLDLNLESEDPLLEAEAFKQIANNCPVTRLSLQTDNSLDITPIFQSIASFKNLVQFSLLHFDGFGPKLVFDDKCIGSSSLQFIHIATRSLSKKFLTHLNQPNLVTLSIHHVKFQFNDKVLRPLIGLKRIQKITLHNEIRVEHIIPSVNQLIASTPSLESLKVSTNEQILINFNNIF